MRGPVILLAAAAFFSATAASQVFHRCVDADGNVTFSDRRCPTTMAPSSVEVRPNVLDSAGARQVVRQQAERDRRTAEEQQLRAMEQQRRAIQAGQRSVQEASQQDRAQSDAMLREAQELRRQAGQRRDMSDRAALNRRARGLEDSAAISRGISPKPREPVIGVVNPLTGEFYPAVR